MQKLDTILLIDDDDIANFVNQDLISGLSIAYSIPIANNGIEALNFLKKNILKSKNKISGLILLDIQMPEMDGYEFLVHFKNMVFQKFHNLKLAILTSEPCLEKSKMNNFDSVPCLQKPLTEDKIINLLDTLNKHEPPVNRKITRGNRLLKRKYTFYDNRKGNFDSQLQLQ